MGNKAQNVIEAEEKLKVFGRAPLSLISQNVAPPEAQRKISKEKQKKQKKMRIAPFPKS